MKPVKPERADVYQTSCTGCLEGGPCVSFRADDPFCVAVVCEKCPRAGLALLEKKKESNR